MKKLLLFVLLLIGGDFIAFGQNQIPVQVIRETPAGHDNPLAPPRPWCITQDENVLIMPAFEDDLTLQLRDENDTVVYSTYVPAGTTQVVLPTTLSGEFELRLIPFNATYYYRGYLIL